MPKEVENVTLQIKENINLLINNGQIEEAKILVDEYKRMVSDDIEIYSIDAVLLIMEEKLQEAEAVLKEGIERESDNEDLLLNMSYLMDKKNRSDKAIEYFCKAKLFNPDSNIKVEDIISNLKTIDNNNLKVLHGTMEIANQMCTITEGLKKIGVDAKTLNYYPNYLGYNADYTLNVNSFNNIDEANIETKKLAAKIISENDVFHFHFGTSLTLDYSDLPLLKELDKKVFMHHHGSDVRIYDIAYKNNSFISEKVRQTNSESVKRKLEFLAKNIDSCIVSDYEIVEYVKSYYNHVKYIPLMIDLNNFKISKSKNKKNSNKLLIVHAPTNQEYKGTKHIINAFNELKIKYPNIELKLVQGVSHEEALKIYQKADLIIDQILTGSYGVFSIESMAMGKPVMCWISDFMKEKYPKDLPIISANPITIKNKLEGLIKNSNLLENIGKKGRRYVEKYHSINKTANEIYRIYNNI